MKGELIAEIMGKMYIATVVITISAAAIADAYIRYSNYVLNKKNQNQK